MLIMVYLYCVSLAHYTQSLFSIHPMRHPLVSLLIFLLLNVASSTVHSENIIYQWFEKNKTFFSDRPHADAKIITLPETRSSYRVKRVVDGDTIQLEDDTKVRLLGINTPEMGNRFHSEEAGGKRAKQWLNTVLKGQRIHLETDTERLDKYGRTLAHVFTEDDLHINVELVRKGFAAVSIYPPNVRYSTALIAAQAEAEAEQVGLWGDENYAVKSIDQLNEDNRHGWQRLTGTVQNVRRTRQYFYLEFGSHFNARIHKSNAQLFPSFDTYIGKTVEMRGLLNQLKDQTSLLIRHPDALRVL